MKDNTRNKDENLPEIIAFYSEAPAVQNKEAFSLGWDVKDATHLEIYKNGVLVEKCGGEETGITLRESYDGKDKWIQYTLVALNSYGQTKSEPVSVKITEKVEKADVVPVIVYFKSSAGIVRNGESFTLSWEVKNAANINIYKNGIIYRKFSADKTSVTISEFYDGKDKDIKYTLVALSDTVQSESSPVIVTITDKQEAKPVVKEVPVPPVTGGTEETQTRYIDNRDKKLKKIRIYLWGLLLAVLALVIVIINYFSSRPKILDFDPKLTKEEHTVIIVGKNFPKDSVRLQVLFNNIRGSIRYSSEEIIRVVVPVMNINEGDDTVSLSVVIGDDTLKASEPLVIKSSATQEQTAVNEEITLLPDTMLPARDTIRQTVKKKNNTRADVVINTKTDSVPVTPDTQRVVKDDAPKIIIDISKMVQVTNNEFKRRALGGIENLELTVHNNSPFDIDEVNVVVSYTKKNERVIRNENVVFTNINAHAKSIKSLPDTKRGAKINAKISSIKSRQHERHLRSSQ